MKTFCIMLAIQFLLFFGLSNRLLSQQNTPTQSVPSNSAMKTAEQLAQEAMKSEDYGNYPKAAECWSLASRQATNVKDQVFYMYRAGRSYKFTRNYNEALYFFNQATNLAKNTNDIHILSYIYFDYANAVYERSGQRDTLSAINLINKAVQCSEIDAQNYAQGSVDAIWRNDWQTEILIERAGMRAQNKNFRDALLDFGAATREAKSNWTDADRQFRNGKISKQDSSDLFKRLVYCLYIEGYCFYDKYMAEKQKYVVDGVSAIKRFEEKLDQDKSELIKKKPEICWYLGLLHEEVYKNNPEYDEKVSLKYKLASAELGYPEAILWWRNSNQRSIIQSFRTRRPIKPIITMKANMIDYNPFPKGKIPARERYEVSGTIFYDQENIAQAQATLQLRNPQTDAKDKKNIKLQHQNSSVFSFVDTIDIPEKYGLWEITASANYQNEPNVEGSYTVKRTPFFDQDQKNRFTGNNTAILFANNYEGTRAYLRNPIYDAEALASTLDQRFGFRSTIFREASSRMIREELDKLRNVPKAFNDQLVVVLSGHGAEDGSFLAINERKQVEAVYYQALKKQLIQTGYKRILLIIDACFSGTAVANKSIAYNSSFASRGSQTRSMDFGTNNQTLIYSSNQNQVANEAVRASEECYQIITSGDRQTVDDGIFQFHSPFVKRLLEILENAEANVFPADIDSQMKDLSSRPRFSKFHEEGSSGEFCFESLRYK